MADATCATACRPAHKSPNGEASSAISGANISWLWRVLVSSSSDAMTAATCPPEQHWRLTVCTGTDTGKPARNMAMRHCGGGGRDVGGAHWRLSASSKWQAACGCALCCACATAPRPWGGCARPSSPPWRAGRRIPARFQSIRPPPPAKHGAGWSGSAADAPSTAACAVSATSRQTAPDDKPAHLWLHPRALQRVLQHSADQLDGNMGREAAPPRFADGSAAGRHNDHIVCRWAAALVSSACWGALLLRGRTRWQGGASVFSSS